jgi:hypothetical protein
MATHRALAICITVSEEALLETGLPLVVTLAIMVDQVAALMSYQELEGPLPLVRVTLVEVALEVLVVVAVVHLPLVQLLRELTMAVMGALAPPHLLLELL